LSSIFATESIVGDYKLNGTDVLYTWITRADEALKSVAVLPVPLTTCYYLASENTDLDYNCDDLPTNANGDVFLTLVQLGQTQDVPFDYPLPTGSAVGQKRNGPLSDASLQQMGIALNLSLYEDGTGQIYEGSFYPGVDFDLGECESSPTGIAVTDYLEYSSDKDANLTAFSGSMIGTPATGPYAGQDGMGSFGLSTTDVFDYFPSTPQLVNNADFVDGYADVQMPCSYYPLDENGDSTAPDGCANFGYTGGFYTKGNVAPWLDFDSDGDGADDMMIPGQDAGDVYLEWHATDGTASQSGYGELDFDPTQAVETGGEEIFYHGVDADGESVEYWNPDGLTTCILGDEDCDGTPFDRILGVTGPPIVYWDPACGPPASAVESLTALATGTTAASALNYPLFGTVAALSAGAQGAVYGGCLASVSAGVEGLCLQSGGVANTVYGGCVDQANGEILATCNTYLAGAQGQVNDGCDTYCSDLGLDDTMGDTWTQCWTQCFYSQIDAAEAAAIGGVIGGACVSAGGPSTIEESIAAGLGGMTCSDIGAAYAVDANGSCEVAAGMAGASCEDSSGASLCCLAGGIGAATYADCGAFADSYDDDSLNELAVGVVGMTCSGAAQGYVDGCIGLGDANAGREFNVMDARFGAWGGMFTANAALAFGTCSALAASGAPYWDVDNGVPTQACLDADLSGYGYVYADDSAWDYLQLILMRVVD
jgi:hypothetical protein